jgi:hypothetical protein
VGAPAALRAMRQWRLLIDFVVTGLLSFYALLISILFNNSSNLIGALVLSEHPLKPFNFGFKK